jgi:Skp family chaperone for outer membrane proteins
MNRFFFGAAIAALSISIPVAADAQRNRNNDNAAAAPVILIVDTEKVLTECNACRAATTQLEQQGQQLQQRVQQLRAPLQTESQSIQTALNALSGRQPDAALQARITAFQNKENAANQELNGRQQTLRSIQVHVSQQLGDALGPILEQMRAQRNALVVMGKNATLASATNIEITNEVLTALNASTPSVQVTPMPQQPQQPASQPQGR